MVPRSRLRDGGRGRPDVFSSVVRSACASAEDDVHVLVAARLYDRGKALLSDTHEGVRVRARAHRIHRNGHLSSSNNVSS